MTFLSLFGTKNLTWLPRAESTRCPICARLATRWNVFYHVTPLRIKFPVCAGLLGIWCKCRFALLSSTRCKCEEVRCAESTAKKLASGSTLAPGHHRKKRGRWNFFLKGLKSLITKVRQFNNQALAQMGIFCGEERAKGYR